MQTQTKPNLPSAEDQVQQHRIERVLTKRSFAMLSTVSQGGFPHAAGVVYDNVGTTLFVHTMRSSRKARNVVASGRAAVVIPTRKVPVGPPFTVQFQATASVLAMDAPEIIALLDADKLGAVSGHGALDEPDGCFIKIEPHGSIHTYGIGVPLLDIARDPLHAGPRTVTLSGG